MRAFEIGIAVIFAIVALIIVKIAGFVLKVALIAAVAGLLLGFVIAKVFNRSRSAS